MAPVLTAFPTPDSLILAGFDRLRRAAPTFSPLHPPLKPRACAFNRSASSLNSPLSALFCNLSRLQTRHFRYSCIDYCNYISPSPAPIGARTRSLFTAAACAPNRTPAGATVICHLSSGDEPHQSRGFQIGIEKCARLADGLAQGLGGKVPRAHPALHCRRPSCLHPVPRQKQIRPW